MSAIDTSRTPNSRVCRSRDDALLELLAKWRARDATVGCYASIIERQGYSDKTMASLIATLVMEKEILKRDLKDAIG